MNDEREKLYLELIEAAELGDIGRDYLVDRLQMEQRETVPGELPFTPDLSEQARSLVRRQLEIGQGPTLNPNVGVSGPRETWDGLVEFHAEEERKRVRQARMEKAMTHDPLTCKVCIANAAFRDNQGYGE